MKALKLAALGIPVFLCQNTPDNQATHKTPFPGTRGFHDATTDVGIIGKWMKRWPDALVGVPTGAPSGISVLDLDLKKHPASRVWLDNNRHRLPQTRRQQTRGFGGWHVLFQDRPGLKSSAGQIWEGVDVRATGGYIVWWSDAPASDFRHQLAPWPEWLAPPPVALPVRAGGRPIQSGRYGRVALEAEVAMVAGTSCARNVALNKSAFKLFQIADLGKLDAGEIQNRLIDACHANNLIRDKGIRRVMNTLRSAEAGARRKPRAA